MYVTAILIISIAVLGGIVQSIVIAKNYAAALRLPLDFGRRLRNRRIFGKNKTWRGAVTMTLFSGFAAVVIYSVTPSPFSGLENTRLGALLFGLMVGAWYILGELPNSFIKRQMDIPPGGLVRRWWYLIDQSDSVIGICVGLWLGYHLPMQTLLIVALAGTTTHIVFDRGLYVFGVKKRQPSPTVSSE